MLEIFLCDDNKVITDYLDFFIKKNFGTELNTTILNSCRELFSKVEMNCDVPDIIITDINLGDGNAIEVIKLIQQSHPHIKVIYLTGYVPYAADIFETNPSYFLTKPINENKLQDAIVKAIQSCGREHKDMLALKSSGVEMVVMKNDIVFIESKGRKLIFHTVDKGTVEIYEKMDDIQTNLDGRFLRIHKSYLVNMRFISERTNNSVSLFTGDVLPISKANQKEVKTKFITYLGDPLWE